MGFFVNGRLDSKGAIEGGVLVFFVEMNWVDVGWKVLILGDVRIHHCNQNVSDFSMKTTCFFKPPNWNCVSCVREKNTENGSNPEGSRMSRFVLRLLLWEAVAKCRNHRTT